jgi:hypothetical protein
MGTQVKYALCIICADWPHPFATGTIMEMTYDMLMLQFYQHLYDITFQQDDEIP